MEGPDDRQRAEAAKSESAVLRLEVERLTTTNETQYGWSPDQAMCVLRFWQGWVTPLVRRGMRAPLTKADLPSTPKWLRSSSLHPNAIKLWEDEKKRATCAKAADPKSSPSFITVCHAVGGPDIRYGCALLAVHGVLAAVVRPLLLRYAVHALRGSSDGEAYRYVAGLSVTILVEGWTRVQGLHYAGDLALLRIISSAMQLISLKACTLRPGATSEGYEHVLFGKDLVGIAELARMLPNAVVCAVELVGGTTMLFALAGGGPAAAGLGVMIVVFIVSMSIAMMIGKHNLAMLEAAEVTVGVTREIIDGTKVVKMMGWEDAYLEHCALKRAIELRSLMAYRVMISVVWNLSASSHLLAAATMCTILSLTGALSVEIAMPSILLLVALRVPFIFVPGLIQIWIMTTISARRVGAYLLLPEQAPLQPLCGASALASAAAGGTAGEPSLGSPPSEPPSASEGRIPLLVLQDASISWPDSSPKPPVAQPRSPATRLPRSPAIRSRRGNIGFRRSPSVSGPGSSLKQGAADGEKAERLTKQGAADGEKAERLTSVLPALSLTLNAGSLVAIIGPMSSGKSSLLAAAWNEARLLSGSIASTPDVAIVPQRPFTIAGTLEDNIVTGRLYNAALLERVVADCELSADLASMPLGLLTEVGERGFTLSGGQQQRIALARALYGQPQLLLLDDPLSAVDTRTGALILASLERYVREGSCRGGGGIGGSGGKVCGGRTALVAVSQMHHLRAFDRVLTLDEGNLTSDQLVTEILEDGGELAAQITNGGGSVDDLVDSSGGAGEEKKGSGGVEGTAIPSQLHIKEAVNTGGFSASVYWQFLSALGYPQLFVWLGLLIVTWTAYLLTDVWLTLWIASLPKNPPYPVTLPDNTSLTLVPNSTPHAAEPSSPSRTEPVFKIDLAHGGFVGIYFALGFSHVVFYVLTSVWASVIGVKASRTLHFEMIKRIVHAPLSWFEKTPSGRILSRFTSDLQVVDTRLTMDIDTVANSIGISLSLFIYVAIVVPILVIVLVIMILAFGFLAWIADTLIREARRMANNTMSSTMSAVSENKDGTALIRAMRLQAFFAARQSANIEEWAKLHYYVRALQAWSGHIGSFLSSVFAMTTMFVVVGTRVDRSPEQSSLALMYALSMPSYIGVLADFYVQVRQDMASLERLLEFHGIEQEAPHKLATDPTVSEWPCGGAIVFKDVCMSYRAGLPLSLAHFSATIEAHQKVGIVGRTGAGKSTLILALFRLVEPTSGTITVDGRDIGQLGLRALRRALAIIPQDPVLHQGTVARNLDPFGKVPEKELRNCLSRVQMPEQMLEFDVAKGGTNLSSGERQRLCFARALLQRAPILILDEATSNLDDHSDDAIQTLLRDEFSGRTLLTIAHRLNTVIDYDRLLVMGEGKLLEHGAPYELLTAPQGVLAGMVRVLGKANGDLLLDKSRSSSFIVNRRRTIDHVPS